MNVLDRFEQSFERLVEGSVGRLFRSPIQPAEIGRKLERAMVSRRVVTVDGAIVPNAYRVWMHPADLKAFEAFIPALCKQMSDWLADLADERGFTLLEHVTVEILADEHVPRRAIQVEATVADRPAVRPSRQDMHRTALFDVQREPANQTGIRLRFLGGPDGGAEFVLRKSMTTVGRALDNDIVIDSEQVSRHHARIEIIDGAVRVVDLNSTNGTHVNGRTVRIGNVRIGDEVMFGTLIAHVLPL